MQGSYWSPCKYLINALFKCFATISLVRELKVDRDCKQQQQTHLTALVDKDNLIDNDNNN